MTDRNFVKNFDYFIGRRENIETISITDYLFIADYDEMILKLKIFRGTDIRRNQ